MLRQVDIYNSAGEVLNLPLEDVSQGIIVRNIDGLGPVKATLVRSSYATLDGTFHHNARREDRNILITLGMEPAYGSGTVADIRSRLYKFFMTKTRVRLAFHMESGLDVEIEGYVESCEPPMFTADPQMVVSIICNNPDFEDKTIRIEGVIPTIGTGETIVPYEGSVDTGVYIDTTFSDPQPGGITIFHRAPSGESTNMVITHQFQAGDEMIVNTVPGQKIATVTRAGNIFSILNDVSPYAKWVTLDQGDNAIRIEAASTNSVFFSWTDKYGGL